MQADFAAAGLAQATQRKYDRAWATFVALAAAAGVPALPVSPWDFEAIISAYAQAKRSTALVSEMTAAVNHFHGLAGFAAPGSSRRARLTLRGISRAYAKPPKQALPLSPCMIKSATATLGDDLMRTTSFTRSVALWRTVAAMAFSFSTLARFNCMTKIKMRHIQFFEDGASIFFPHSKTDQLGRGQTVFLNRLAGSHFCPVLLLKAYTLRLQYEAFRAGTFPFEHYLFPALRRVRGQTQLTRLAFSRQGATKALRDLLSDLGTPDPSAYTLHSGRRGGATFAAMNGCDFLSLKRQGRWRSDVSPQIYIDEAHTRNNNFTSFLGL